jgi:transposase
MDENGVVRRETEAKASFWRRTLEDWMASGLSGREYQRQHELSRNAFTYWKLKLFPAKRRRARMVEVSVPVAQPKGLSGTARGLLIHMGDTLTLEVPSGFNPRELGTVVETLRRCTG